MEWFDSVRISTPRHSATTTTKRTSRVFRGRPTSSSVEISDDATCSTDDDDDDADGYPKEEGEDTFVLGTAADDGAVEAIVGVVNAEIPAAVEAKMRTAATADEQNFMVVALE